MVDFSFIGKEGLIVQYEDVVSMIGFNVITYLRSKNVCNKASKMSEEDILLSYLNREKEDISAWLKREFDVDFDINEYLESIHALRPNMQYSYKVFDTAYKNGIKNLIVHSNQYSPIIEKFVTQSYQLPVKYTYGDIVPVLNSNKNATFLTSNPNNIKACLNVKVPMALTIVDDFMYVADILLDKVDEQLRERNVFVCFTGVISAGIIS